MLFRTIGEIKEEMLNVPMRLWKSRISEDKKKRTGLDRLRRISSEPTQIEEHSCGNMDVFSL